MTDNNKIQANEVSCSKTPANLTEQWEKGELPDGHYYVKDGENIIAELLDGYFYNNGEPMTSFSGGVDEVLAEVPTYEEYQATENYIDYLKQCISVYEDKEKQHTKDSILFNDVSEAYRQCIDLLMKCRFYLSQKERTPKQADEVLDLISIINNMVGERQ